jgi:hypothetical protein
MFGVRGAFGESRHFGVNRGRTCMSKFFARRKVRQGDADLSPSNYRDERDEIL